jgi:4-oxalocrotonate tautomerase
MPFINLKLIGKLTRQQKETIAKEFSDTLLKVAGKPKEQTVLFIDETSGESWAYGDKLLG